MSQLIWHFALTMPCFIYTYLEECLRQASKIWSLCKLQYKSNFKTRLAIQVSINLEICYVFYPRRRTRALNTKQRERHAVDSNQGDECFTELQLGAGCSTHPSMLAYEFVIHM